ncbi:MAG: hypothetical protein ACYDD1_15830 [Caulobacteraceae bacterium]
MSDTDAQTSLAVAEQALASGEQAMAAKSSTAAARIAAAVAAWVQTSLAGGPIARNVDGWNQLQAALPALVTAIKEII